MGTTKRVNIVPTRMPEKMTRPIEERAAAPAPDAMMSGTTPRAMAAVVIRIGLSLVAAASSIAARRLSPLSACSLLAKSTIKMPCFEISPISVTSPTCV